MPASRAGKLDMDEAALRKLTRAELQKLAKVCFRLRLSVAVVDLIVGTQCEGKREKQFDYRDAHGALQSGSASVGPLLRVPCNRFPDGCSAKMKKTESL